jgi:hypothetical protein
MEFDDYVWVGLHLARIGALITLLQRFEFLYNQAKTHH